jgi:predicted secreted protein
MTQQLSCERIQNTAKLEKQEQVKHMSSFEQEVKGIRCFMLDQNMKRGTMHLAHTKMISLSNTTQSGFKSPKINSIQMMVILRGYLFLLFLMGK